MRYGNSSWNILKQFASRPSAPTSWFWVTFRCTFSCTQMRSIHTTSLLLKNRGHSLKKAIKILTSIEGVWIHDTRNELSPSAKYGQFFPCLRKAGRTKHLPHVIVASRLRYSLSSISTSLCIAVFPAVAVDDLDRPAHILFHERETVVLGHLWCVKKAQRSPRFVCTHVGCHVHVTMRSTFPRAT